MGLELLAGVEQARADGAGVATQNFTNFFVRQTLNVMHRYNETMYIRQLEHGLVQFLLEFGEIDFAARGFVGDEGEEVWIAFGVEVEVVEAEGGFILPLFEEVDGFVDCDSVDPCEEAGVAFEGFDGLEGFDEGVLG